MPEAKSPRNSGGWGMAEPQSPATAEGGEWQSPIPRNSGGWGMAKPNPPRQRRVGNAGDQIPRGSGMGQSPPRQRSSPQSPRPQDDGTPNPLHAPLQPTLTVPPVEKPYEWHIKSTPQASLRYFKRAIVLRNGGTAEQQNGNLDKPL